MGLIVAAFTWSLAVIGAAFFLPVYAQHSSPGALAGSDTLIGVNGLGVLIPVSLPAVMTIGIAGALWLERTRASRTAGTLATIAIVLLGGVCLIAPIGGFVLPIPLLLFPAAVLNDSGDHRRDRLRETPGTPTA
jgi:hypothetical protein